MRIVTKFQLLATLIAIASFECASSAKIKEYSEKFNYELGDTTGYIYRNSVPFDKDDGVLKSIVFSVQSEVYVDFFGKQSSEYKNWLLFDYDVDFAITSINLFDGFHGIGDRIWPTNDEVVFKKTYNYVFSQQIEDAWFTEGSPFLEPISIGMFFGARPEAEFNQGHLKISGTHIFSYKYVYEPSAVPEPSVWSLLIVGFGLAGQQLRRVRRNSAVEGALSTSPAHRW